MTLDPENDRTQEAVARRLAKLGAMPIDTAHLDRRMREVLPAAPRSHWWKPLSAIAASVLVIVTIVLATLPRPVQASGDLMVQMHNDIVSGKVPTMKVDSIEQANAAIAAMAQDAPQLPGAPAEHTMACCMRKVGKKQVSCVLLKNEGVPVTMSVAKAADVTPPQDTSTEVFNGVSYHVQTIGKLHMVMLSSNGNWICLISEAPTQSLIDLAARLPH